MLRRSTGVSEERKRVGVSRDMKCASEPVKWRWVARARSSVLLSAVGSESEVVGMGGSEEAMESRREVRGSCVAKAILAVQVCSVSCWTELLALLVCIHMNREELKLSIPAGSAAVKSGLARKNSSIWHLFLSLTGML